jgi:hypothetical protein
LPAQSWGEDYAGLSTTLHPPREARHRVGAEPVDNHDEQVERERLDLAVVHDLRGLQTQTLTDANADTVAKALGIRLHRLDVRHAADYEAAFETAVKERVDAVLVSPASPLPDEAAKFALRHRLPTMTLMGSVGQVGQLFAYGANFSEQVLRVASYVDRILKGAKPSDLPVEQAQRFELVINLKTAKALGLTIPPSLLLRADQMIE